MRVEDMNQVVESSISKVEAKKRAFSEMRIQGNDFKKDPALKERYDWLKQVSWQSSKAS